MDQKTIILLAVMGVFCLIIWPVPDPPKSVAVQAPKVGAVDFSLMTAGGQKVTSANLRGRPTLLCFGTSRNADVSSQALAEMAKILKDMGPYSDKFAPVFVTLDPAYDAPAVLAKYLRGFDPRIVGLTGGNDAIDAMARQYKVTTAPDTGAFLPSTNLYLLDAKGEFLRHFDGSTPLGLVENTLKDAICFPPK